MQLLLHKVNCVMTTRQRIPPPVIYVDLDATEEEREETRHYIENATFLQKTYAVVIFLGFPIAFVFLATHFGFHIET